LAKFHGIELYETRVDSAAPATGFYSGLAGSSVGRSAGRANRSNQSHQQRLFNADLGTPTHTGPDSLAYRGRKQGELPRPDRL